MPAKPVVPITAPARAASVLRTNDRKLAICPDPKPSPPARPEVQAELRAELSPLYPTIFHEDWWLDAASRGRYSEVTVSSGGRVVGRLPYLRQSMCGLTECVLPTLAPFGGPAIDEGKGRPTRRQQTRRNITHALLEQLPEYSRFQQRFHGGITDTLPFVEKGFESRAEFTYEVPPAASDTLWRNMRDKTRNVIRRAQEQSTAREIEPEQFCRLYSANLRRKGKRHNYMWRNEADALFRAAIARGRGKLIGARDAEGSMVAGVFIAWDAVASYLVLTTRAPGTHNGIISRLIWDAMADAAANRRVFDFGGVGTRGSVLFYSGFGGEVRPRYLVERASPFFTTLDYSLRKSRGLKGKLLARLTPAMRAGGSIAPE